MRHTSSNTRRRLSAATALAALSVAGCSEQAATTVGSHNASPAASAAVQGTTYGLTTRPDTLTVGTATQLATNAPLLNGQPRPLAWSSSDTLVLSVSSTGLVTGRSVGKALVRVAAGTSSDTTTVRVIPLPILVRDIVLSAPASLTIGDTVTVTGVAKDAKGATLAGPITWTGGPATVATVQGGAAGASVLAVGAGSLTVYATMDTVTRSVTIPVKAKIAIAAVPATVTLTANATTLKVGEKVTATAVVKDAAGNLLSNTVLWRSSSPSIASVVTSGAQTGTLSALAPGTLTLSAGFSNTMKSDLTITVIDSSTVVVPPVVPSLTALAALPRATVATGYPAMTRQVRVAAGADLQAAINAAQPGDELLLAPGATYVGNYTLPNKGTSTSWIVIRTDLSDATIGLAGTRMTPSRASGVRLAKVLSANYAAAIGTAPGAHHYRLTGLEIATTSAATTMNVLVRFGDDAANGQRTMASVPHDLIIDRDYIHGSPTLDMKRCVTFNSASTAAVDSWISECHSNNTDSQAILGYNGQGPFAILNNHLEAGHEIVMWGGSDPAMQSMTPSDITLRGNYITRPASWKGRWQTKNILETKNVHHYLVEKNVIDGVWQDAQAGFAIVMKSENQGNTAPYSQTADVTIRLNRIRNAGSGFNFSGKGSSSNPNVAAARFTVTDNVIDGLNTGPYTGEGIALQVLSDMQDLYFAHNTILNQNGIQSSIVFDGVPSPRLTMHSNIFSQAVYGLKGAGTSSMNTLAKFAPGALWAANAMVGASCGNYPSGTICPTSFATLGFQNFAAADYQLLSTSSLTGKAHGGGNVGANVAAVNAATAGVVVAP